MNCNNKYELKFYNIEGLHLSFSGSTKEEIFSVVDKHESLPFDIKDILKNGYFNEFLNAEYKSQNYIIDNCMHFIWEVN